MTSLWVGVTDNDWFDVVSRVPGIDEVNFWQPGGGSKAFRVLQPGEPFLFKLHSPFNRITGGGYFVKQTVLPISLAWEAFDVKNGARSFSEMRALILKRRRETPDSRDDFTIGCVLLTQPFFFSRSEWLPVPSDWHPAIQQGKRYSSVEEPGKSLWEKVRMRLAWLPGYAAPEQRVDDSARYGKETLVRPRLGQGAFRVLVTDAYDRACAITEEHSLPALEAAHIKPFNESGPNAVNNGILLRSDFHRLFDRGYITITPEYRIEISRRLKEEFENGRSYYPFHGHKLSHLPVSSEDCPQKELLTWHNERIFRD
jgi:putative restriction endonuclease